MKSITILIALLYVSFANGQVIKDTIFFTNGSLVIGKVLKVKLGVITFDPDDANDITVQMRKLKTIGATTRIFRVETIFHQVYFGTILPHPEKNAIYVKTGMDTVSLKLEYISILYPFDNGVMQRFSGTVGLGFSYTRSSAVGRLNFDANIRYVSKNSELILGLSGIYTIYDSLFSRDKEDLALKYNYYFVRNWFATTFIAYQRNIELGLQRRYQEGFGIGNKFITTRYVYSWGRAGLVFNQEKSTEGISTGTLTELFGQLEVNFFRFEKPKINFLIAQSFYYSLSQSGRFRNDGTMNVTWEIFKNFNLNFGPYNNYDSKPPVKGSPTFDYGVVFGINYKFY